MHYISDLAYGSLRRITMWVPPLYAIKDRILFWTPKTQLSLSFKNYRKALIADLLMKQLSIQLKNALC